MDTENKIFLGEAGLLKFERALTCAQDILKTESLFTHPDFLLIEPNDGTIGTAVAERISEHLSFMPISADRKVVVIRDAHTATREFQNAILKFLEDGNMRCTFLLTTSSDLIDTIQSRCITIKVPRYSEAKMLGYIKNEGLEMDATAKALAAGRPGIYKMLMTEEQAFLQDVKLFVGDFAYIKSCPKKVLGGLLDGKQYENYTKEQLNLFLEFFQNCFFELLKAQISPETLSPDFEFLRYSECKELSLGLLVDITSRLIDDRSIKRKGAYGKNELFQTVRYIYTLLSDEQK